MKLTAWFVAAVAPFAALGLSGAFLGHLAVLAVTLGIFFGTLSLGRHTAPSAGNRAVAAQLDKPA